MSRLNKIEAAIKFYKEAEARAGKANRNVAFLAEDKREIVRLLEVAEIGTGAFAGAMGLSFARDRKAYGKIANRLNNFIDQVQRERAGGGSVIAVSAVRQPVAAPVVRHVKTQTLDGKLLEIRNTRRELEKQAEELDQRIFKLDEQETVLQAAIELLK